ncbi:hypothetical protein MCOR07_011595, partial [Pyricularia oryzae]
MHTPSFVKLLLTGLAATSAVNGFDLGRPTSLATRHVGALVALAGSALALPAVERRAEIETPRIAAREPHHAGKGTGKKKGGKKNGGKKNGRRDLEEADTEADEEHDLETRAPHHAGKGTGKKKGGKKNGG